MKKNACVMNILVFILLSLVACNYKGDIYGDNNVEINELNQRLSDINYDKEIWPNTLSIGTLYSEIMDDISVIELRNGTNGNSYTIKEPTILLELTDLLYQTQFTIKDDQSLRTGWMYSIKCINSEGKWFRYTLGYGFEDNLRSKGEVISSPYYSINDEMTIIKDIEEIEKTLN